jgi:hypothetical protein
MREHTMKSEVATHRVKDLEPEARAVVEFLVGGVLRDEDRVSLLTSRGGDALESEDASLGARQREARLRLLAELDKLPIENPGDGMTAHDHDRVIYGTDS